MREPEIAYAPVRIRPLSLTSKPRATHGIEPPQLGFVQEKEKSNGTA
jgi:hypothetical protein